MVPLAQARLTLPAVAGRGLNEGLGRTRSKVLTNTCTANVLG